MKKMRIYLDNCCFNRPYDIQNSITIKIETISKLSIQDEVRAGIVELVWSYILDYENDANPNPLKKRFIGEWDKFAVIDIDESESILETAETLEMKSFKQNDAIHIACAIAAGCDYFITVDNGILKKKDSVTEIAVINPIDYIRRKEVQDNEK